MEKLSVVAQAAAGIIKVDWDGGNLGHSSPVQWRRGVRVDS